MPNSARPGPAASAARGGVPLPQLTGQGRDGKQVWATFETAGRIAKAELNITRDTGKWPDRKWEALPAQLDTQGRVTATLPEGVTVYYLNVFDERGCVASSEHEEIRKDTPQGVPPGK